MGRLEPMETVVVAFCSVVDELGCFFWGGVQPSHRHSFSVVTFTGAFTRESRRFKSFKKEMPNPKNPAPQKIQLED